jgi:hypothetical protein
MNWATYVQGEIAAEGSPDGLQPQPLCIIYFFS